MIKIKFRHSDQTGRSMIEMLGVLAIVGVLSVGGIAGYSKAMTKFRISKSIDQVQTMVSATRALFASEAGYNGLTSATVAKTLGLIPTDMIDSAGNAINAFGGAVTMTTTGTGNIHFTIGFGGLTPDICMELVLADLGRSNPASGLISLNVTGTTTPAGWHWGAAAAPLSPFSALTATTASTACAVASNAPSAIVTWTFR